MSSQHWKCITSSVAGTTHVATETPCQDSNAYAILQASSGSQILVAIVSDGAGSAKHGDLGSALVCSLFLKEIETYVANGGEICELTSECFKKWLGNFKEEIIVRANDRALAPRDFAATLLASIVGDNCGVFVQIGDGAIVIPGDEPESYCWVFWPQQGQYANETNFATDDGAAARLEFALINAQIQELALFTDGLQNLTLEYQSRQAHSPFFLPVFQWLQGAEGQELEKFSSALATFLNSSKVNDRTDDDKTLLLATRRPKSSDLNLADADKEQITTI